MNTFGSGGCGGCGGSSVGSFGFLFGTALVVAFAVLLWMLIRMKMATITTTTIVTIVVVVVFMGITSVLVRGSADGSILSAGGSGSSIALRLGR